jgi:hypothetical protein
MHAEIVAKLAGRKKAFRDDLERHTQNDKLNESFAQQAKSCLSLVAQLLGDLTKCEVCLFISLLCSLSVP